MSNQHQEVNGWPLPAHLLALIDAGRWQRPRDVGPLRALTGLEDARDLLFLGVESMRRNTRELVAERDHGNAELFGLVPAGRAPEAHELDERRAVLIAATFGDGLICLDYGADADRPRVVVTDWSQGRVRWRELAPDIETFAATLGL